MFSAPMRRSGAASRECKRMVQMITEDTTMRKDEQIQRDVRFRVGVAKTLVLPRHRVLVRSPSNITRDS